MCRNPGLSGRVKYTKLTWRRRSPRPVNIVNSAMYGNWRPPVSSQGAKSPVAGDQLRGGADLIALIALEGPVIFVALEGVARVGL